MLIIQISFWSVSFHYEIMKIKIIPNINFMTLQISAGTKTGMRDIFLPWKSSQLN